MLMPKAAATCFAVLIEDGWPPSNRPISLRDKPEAVAKSP